MRDVVDRAGVWEGVTGGVDCRRSMSFDRALSQSGGRVQVGAHSECLFTPAKRAEVPPVQRCAEVVQLRRRQGRVQVENRAMTAVVVHASAEDRTKFADVGNRQGLNIVAQGKAAVAKSLIDVD